MYSYEERIKAVRLYIKYDHSFASVKRELGYPNQAETLKSWFEEYSQENDLHKVYNKTYKYSEEQKQQAINHYYEHGRCIRRTVSILGYPSRTLLKQWLVETHPEDFPDCVKGAALVNFTQEQKEQAVIDLCSRIIPAKDVAAKYGVSRVVLYKWKHQLLPEGSPTKMPKRNKVKLDTEQIKELSDEVEFLTAEAEELKKQVHRLQLERDALQLASEIIKKDQGINLETLTNREKAMVINALRNTYSLIELLKLFNLSKSSYFYQKRSLEAPDKYANVREQLRNSFAESYECYGYRRMHLCVKKPDGGNYSEKVIRRIMQEEHLFVKSIKRKKYNSYQGEISPAVDNRIQRDFHADNPNEKWLTDITEFHIPAGKIYLSPILDCFDGLPVSWTVGTSPNADLVNTMLDTAIATLGENDHPIVHSDRGAHYRWPGWIGRMESAGLIRSMSKKGCSPDNSACEGFFGRLKNEMFYDRDWKGVSIEEFIEYLNRYIHWYAEKRKKLSLNGLSPLQYRRSLGLIS